MNQQRKGWRSTGSTHRTVLVLAGSHAEFLALCRSKRIDYRKAIHVKAASDVRGHRYVQVIKTGTWYLMDREVLQQIVEAIRIVDQVGIAEEEDYSL